jgi:hypothetical protein
MALALITVFILAGSIFFWVLVWKYAWPMLREQARDLRDQVRANRSQQPPESR